MTADLTSLAERLEGATGPDRELDCLLWQMAYPDERVMFDHGKAFGPGAKYPATYGLLKDFPLEKWDDWVGVARHIGAAEVTSSIDAALALVERKLGKHWCWQIKHAIGVEVILWTLETDYDEGHVPATGAHMNSVPIAILIALVRALSNPKART